LDKELVMKVTVRDVASELARRTQDSEDDKKLDLNVAQASHAIRQLRLMIRKNPDGIARALGVRVSITSRFTSSF